MKLNKTINDYIDSYAKNFPEQTFIIDACNDIEINYKTLQEDIWRLKQFFATKDLQPGDRVGFILDNSYSSVLLFLGTIYHGFITLPINIVSGTNSIQHTLKNSNCKLILASQEYQTTFKDILQGACTVCTYDSTEDLPVFDQQDHYHLDNTEQTNAVLIYTSGTTGLPKGVMLTHMNIIAGGNNTAIAHQLTVQDRALCVLPLYHINAEIVTIIAPLVSRSSVVIVDKFRVSNFWKVLEKHQCTWFSIVPTIVGYLLNNDENISSLNLSNIRFARSASAPLPKQLHIQFEKKFNIKIIETMGISEASAQILSNPLDRQKHGSAGKAYGNQVKIVDNNGNEVATGIEGEVIIKGDNIMNYYHSNEKATSETIRDGWLYSGDLGHQDEEGFFFITGRKKELIIKGGENISPREIDEVLYQHNDILEVSAFAVSDKNYGEEIAVCIYLKEGKKLTDNDIVQLCKKQLSNYKIPKYIYFSKEPLPKGPSGKIQRLKIADLYHNSN